MWSKYAAPVRTLDERNSSSWRQVARHIVRLLTSCIVLCTLRPLGLPANPLLDTVMSKARRTDTPAVLRVFRTGRAHHDRFALHAHNFLPWRSSCALSRVRMSSTRGKCWRSTTILQHMPCSCQPCSTATVMELLRIVPPCAFGVLQGWGDAGLVRPSIPAGRTTPTTPVQCSRQVQPELLWPKVVSCTYSAILLACMETC